MDMDTDRPPEDSNLGPRDRILEVRRFFPPMVLVLRFLPGFHFVVFVEIVGSLAVVCFVFSFLFQVWELRMFCHRFRCGAV